MAENNYDLEYTGSMVDRILDTGYDLQNQGYIFRGLASHYTGTPTERTWLIAPTGSTGFGLSSPVPPGSIGICMYNGSSWLAEVLNTLTLDTAPTAGSGNGITSAAVKTLAESITNAIGQLEQSVSDRFTSLTLEDTTGSLQTELLSITLKYVFNGETESITSISILAATAEKAGLMSAADKQKLDAFVTNIRSLRIQDTTAQADQDTEITNTLKWTIGGVTEAITAFTLYAATTSKAGLMSAADKTALDTLPSLINAGYLYAGIATPSTVPSSTSAKIFYIAIEGGTYTNFDNLNVTQGINIIYKSDNAWSAAQVEGIDNEPTAGSDNLVKSGGVKTELALGAVYDVSAHNNGATFESLSALLSDTDLNALIPTAVRKGGMSIKFVQSSDNKYVQYRLMADSWSIDTDNWSFCGDDVYVNNPEYLETTIDSLNHIIEGIKKKGVKFINIPLEIPALSISGFSFETIDTPEYKEVKTDSQGKILEGIRNWEKVINLLLKVPALSINGMTLNTINNPEWLEISSSKDNRIVEGTKKNGTKVLDSLRCNKLSVNDELKLSKEAARKLIVSLFNNEKVVVVDKDGNGDFTTIIAACLDSQNYDKYTIHVNSGVYDLAQEYKNMFGNSYFDNYTDNYNGYIHGRIDAGLFLYPNVSLIGIGLVEITFSYTGSNNYVRNYFSILNTTINNTVENLTLRTTMSNPNRYIIHDDFSGVGGGIAGTNVFKDMIMDAGNCSAIMGCGMGAKNVYIVDNCLLIGNNTIPSISYHNCSNPDYDHAKNKLIVNDCKGVGKCVVITIGPSQEKTMCIVSNSEFTEIVKEASQFDTYGYDNMELVKFNNTETNV